MPGDPTQGMLSYSNISAWIACKYRYDLVYEKKIRPRIDHRPPMLGTVVHAGMAGGILNPSDFYQSAADAIKKWMKEFIAGKGPDYFFDEEIEYLNNDIVATAIPIAQRTLDRLDLARWETMELNGQPVVEMTLKCPLPGWKGFQGTIDWVARDRATGLVWLLDHKTRKQFLPDESEEVSLQMAAYQYLLMRAAKLNTVGSITVQIAAKVPKAPKLNKDAKSMSRAKIATDWPTYAASLLSVGLDPDDYLEMQPKLAEIEWWRMSQAYRSAPEIVNIWKEVIQRAAWDIARKHKHVYRTLAHMTCNNCSVRSFCLADLRGHDTEYLLQTAYIAGHTGEYEEPEPQEEESDSVTE